MLHTMNITATTEDMGRFQDHADLQQYYRSLGLDGLELMPCGCTALSEPFTPADVIGVHLHYFPAWIDFWNRDEAALDREYGNRETWTQVFGGQEPEDLLPAFRQELDLAQRLGAKYVVFHVAECTLGECLTYRPLHRDEEVCDAACRLINKLLDGQAYDFYFLVENLWWSGLTMTDPAVTEALLDGIHYEKKGIMLDTGHLLHTNLDLQSQAEGLAYIHRMLDRHGDLCRWIRGMHLNQSITGDVVKAMVANPMELRGSYWERLSQIYPYIFSIDRHLPFSVGDVAGLLDRLAPEFVTHEFITSSRHAHEEATRTQMRTIYRK